MDAVFQDIHIIEQLLIINATSSALVWRENRIMYRGNDVTARHPLFGAFNIIVAFDSEVQMDTGGKLMPFCMTMYPAC